MIEDVKRACGWCQEPVVDDMGDEVIPLHQRCVRPWAEKAALLVRAARIVATEEGTTSGEVLRRMASSTALRS